MTALEWHECDGQGLKQLAAAGIANLEQNYETVNMLNVFPVPDGDTGINMLLTMRSAWDEIQDDANHDAGTIAAGISKGALMGSRGNSGVILSQLWKGFAESLDGKTAFGAKELAAALSSASQTADNVRGMKPVEGTILTVARDGAKAAEEAAKKSKDIRVVLEKTVEEMHLSVERTPELLVKNDVYILKDAGVVDAGGMGLAFVIEGMLRHLNGETLEMRGGALPVAGETMMSASDIDLSGLEYPYDVQFILNGEKLDIDDITTTIENMGDSALVAGDANTIKVHVHVKNPGEPLGYAAELGMLSDVVVENMREQFQEFVLGRTRPDSAIRTTKPPDVKEGDIAVVSVVPGEGLERVFYSLGAAHVVAGGQTMNPSTEELLEAIRKVPTAKLVLLPNNKNILMAAAQAAEQAGQEGKQVVVVPSTTVPQGISALLSLDPQGELEVVSEAMTAMLGVVETGEITTATRSVKLDGVKVRKGQLIGLHNDDLRVAGDDMQEVLHALLNEMGAANLELVTLYYGNGVSQVEAEALLNAARKEFSGQEFELVEG